jgi:hypothetical protein
MGSTDAERARRYRRHRAGDHSLCDPGRCGVVTDHNVTQPVTQALFAPSARLTFAEAGRGLWDSMTAAGPPSPLQAVLLVEACRIADRLDTLDRQLHGHDWLRFRHDESGTEVTVYVDRVLAEAREQATALKGIVVELAKSAGQAKPSAPTKGGGVLADLAARRAARSSLPAG